MMVFRVERKPVVFNRLWSTLTSFNCTSMTSMFDRLIIMQRLFDTLSRGPGSLLQRIMTWTMVGRGIATPVQDLTNGQLGLLGCGEFW